MKSVNPSRPHLIAFHNRRLNPVLISRPPVLQSGALKSRGSCCMQRSIQILPSIPPPFFPCRMSTPCAMPPSTSSPSSPRSPSLSGMRPPSSRARTTGPLLGAECSDSQREPRHPPQQPPPLKGRPALAWERPFRRGGRQMQGGKRESDG
jgi:hypothetical protein